MVRNVISFDSPTPLVVISGTFTAQQYVDDVLPPIMLLFLSRQIGLIFRRDNVQLHTVRFAMNFLQPIPTIPWTSGLCDLFITAHIWDVMKW